MRFTDSMPFCSCPSKYCAVNKIPQTRKDNRSAVRTDKSVIQCLQKRVTFYNEVPVDGLQVQVLQPGYGLIRRVNALLRYGALGNCARAGHGCVSAGWFRARILTANFSRRIPLVRDPRQPCGPVLLARWLE